MPPTPCLDASFTPIKSGHAATSSLHFVGANVETRSSARQACTVVSSFAFLQRKTKFVFFLRILLNGVINPLPFGIEVNAWRSFEVTDSNWWFWLRDECKPIRGCLEVMKSHPAKFSPVVGDQLLDGSIFTEVDVNAEQKLPGLTTKFISSIAAFEELDFETLPVLQVVSSKMTSEQSTMLKKRNSVHFTHLCLRDGSNDVIMGRLVMYVAHDGHNLVDGDIICLNSFTPLTYTPSGRDNPQRCPLCMCFKPRHCLGRVFHNHL